ncbi:type II secretion system GspH family protein [Candidatus Parcubacteria bacterium]|nr:type II secretion system GspH family protein [Candidatus Parcubacteria bacterium]
MIIKKQKAFTLVELLVVIGILGILAAVVLVAVNPARQMAQARDTQRRADVNTIITAVSAYMADPVNNGALPAGIATLCSVGADNIGTAVGGADLGAVVAPTYVADIPMDPVNGTAADTLYDICIADATANRITVSAPGTELATTTISATR